MHRTTTALTEKFVSGIDIASATGQGDPKECRQHALNCVHLADGASTPEMRDHFAKLARTWIKLADELEQSEAFLRAIGDDELIKQTG